MTDATPTQPTGSGKLIWRKPLTRDVVAFGTLPDPRDAFIAEQEARYFKLEQELNDANARIRELKAALLWIMQYAANQRIHPLDRCLAVYSHAQLALVEVPSPESDMAITQEAMDA